MKRAFLGTVLAFGLAIPAAAAPDRYPQTTMLGNVAAQVDNGAVLCGVQIFISAGLDRQSGAQNGYASLLAEVVARTPVAVPKAGGGVKLPLRDAIASLGASLAETVEPQDVRYYVEGRPAVVVTALGMLGAALAVPDFSPGTLRAAKTALRSRIEDADQSPFGVVSSMLRSAYYPGSGAGYSPDGSPSAVANAGPDDLRAFWGATYRRGSAAASAAGRVDGTIASAAQGVVDRLPAGTVAEVALKTKAPSDPPARIVTHRDVTLPWVGIGFAAPAAGEKDFAAMMVVQSLIASLGQENTITTQPPALRSINAIYQYDVKPANFIIYANGDALSATSGVREIFAVTTLLASKPLDASTIERYRVLTAGEFVTGYVTLEERAALVGSFARQGLGPDYANQALAAIESVSADDVERVAKDYLQKYTVALVLPRSPGALLGR